MLRETDMATPVDFSVWFTLCPRQSELAARSESD